MNGGLPMARARVAANSFYCGPLEVTVRARSDGLARKIAETLELYDLRWDGPYRPVSIIARQSNLPDARARGDFLRCGRMLVDRTAHGLHATTTSGARARARFSEDGERWHVAVSDALVEAGKLEEIEDILSLVLTTGWRREGWTPVHAAAVVKNGLCAIFCAPTGGGKTTLTAAFVRRGWQVLGDDKLLLRLRDGAPEIAALLHTFNLHPRTRDWFPEVGDLERLPRYSVWTEKRKVSASSIWSHAPCLRARPSVLVALRRQDSSHGPVARPMEVRDTLATLLRQTVIPSDPATARPIVATVAGAASRLRGVVVEIATDAYRHPSMLDELEAIVRGAA